MTDLATYMGHSPTRPLNEVENTAEIHAYFDNEVDNHGGRPRAQLTCSWCGEQHRSNRAQMLTWFTSGHTCRVDDQRATFNAAILAEHRIAA